MFNKKGIWKNSKLRPSYGVDGEDLNL